MKTQISSILRIAAITLATAFSGALAVAQPLQSTAVNTPESCANIADGDGRQNSSVIQEELELENLADLKIKIESIKALGSQSESAMILSALNHDFKDKFHVILDKFIGAKLVRTQEEFVVRLKEKISQRFKVLSAEREATETAEVVARAEEKDALQFIEFAKKARFYDLKPAEFSFKAHDDRRTERHIKIEQPFAMMDTDLSQAMWVWLKLLSRATDLNDLNPSYYKSESDSPETFTTVSVGTSAVGLVPDLPVEYVSNDKVEQFLKDLNRLSNSDDEEIHTQIRRAFPDHQRGSYYALPTLEQMIFVQSNRGVNTSKYFDSDLENVIWNYAWTGGIANSTRPVKSRQPRMIDTGYGVQVPFFDLTGNVWKLTKSTHLEWNQNPLDAPLDGGWAVTGGAVDSAPSFTKLGVSWPQSAWPKRFTGVRLIRYAPSMRPAIERQELLEAQEKAMRAQELNKALTQVHTFKDIVQQSHKLDFVEIKPSDFVVRLGKWDSKANEVVPVEIPAKLTRDFAMATMPVTQMVWSKIQLMLGQQDPAKINPSKFKVGRQSLLVSDNGIQFHIRPDNPVENISPREVSDWISGLNRLSGDRSPGVQEMLKGLIPGHKPGDVYDLPTLAQFGFVAQNRGENNLRFFDRDDPSEYSQYSSCRKNSFNQTLPVKSLKPRIIDTGFGRTAEFYDLIGNVEVMVKEGTNHNDSFTASMLVRDKEKRPFSVHGLTACGTSFYSSEDMDSDGAYLGHDNTYDRSLSHVGIRLVRYRSFWRKFF